MMTEPRSKGEKKMSEAGFTINDLMGFYDQVRREGKMQAPLSYARKSSLKTISKYLNDNEKNDVPTIDIDELAKRIEQSGEMDSNKIKQHMANLRRAIKEYMSYKENPDAWEPPSQRTRVEREDATKGNKGKPKSKYLTYHFPLRPKVFVTLDSIPYDMTLDEAERLAAFIRMLVAPTPTESKTE